MADVGGWTFGAELEWPDVDRRAELGGGWAWSVTDYTVVNSDGTANDPRGELNRWGGELNTPVCGSVEELGERAGEMRAQLKPGHNYRSNLHIHVAAPEFADVENLKRIAEFSRRELPGALKMMDPLNGLFSGLTDEAEVAGARKRMAHSERSRHYFVSDARHARRMEARGIEEMLRAEVPMSREGAPCWALASREAVNLRSMRKHGTIELRCFAADGSGENVWAAASFSRDWLATALEGGEVFELPYFYSLPIQPAFELKLERGWEWTNLKHNRRNVVRGRLAEMRGLCES